MNHQKIRIAFVITGLNQGGAEAMLFKLLNGLDRGKFECLVVSMSDMGVYGDKITALGIPVFCLKMNSVRFSFIGFFYFLKIICNYKPKIIQGWMYHANILSAFSKLICPRTKVLFNIRHSLHFSEEKWALRFFIKMNACASHFSDCVVNNSLASIQMHEQIGFVQKKSLYIGNGFDLTRFAPNLLIHEEFRKKHNLSLNTKIVGNLSRYDVIKNHFGMLYVLKALTELSSASIVLVLGGTEVHHKNMQLVDKIHELHLIDRCILLGPIKSAEIIPAFDVYLSASWSESFPNVIGEAMACSVPCVATDVGDCKQIMGGLGAVAAPGDYDLLAKHCLEKFDICNEERGRIRQHIIDNYSIEKIVDQYQNLYADILNREN